MQKFDFDLAPKSVPVTLDGIKHVLREASDDAACRYEAARARPLSVLDGRMSGLEGAVEAESLLLSLCLYKTTPAGELALLPNGEPDPATLVSIFVIRGWVSRVTRPLIEWVKETSELTLRRKDADPEMVGRCRRELAQAHAPDVGGEPGVMKGVNLACDWLRDRVRESAKNPQLEAKA